MVSNKIFSLVIFTGIVWLILDQIYGKKHIGNFANLIVDSFAGKG